jgi:RNA polymerase sigma factor (sigma-70 family)
MAFNFQRRDEAFGVPDSAGTLADRRSIDSETPETLCAPAETADLIRAAISGLNFRQQAVIIGRYYDGLTFAELGEELGISEPAAFQLHSRACKRLRISLELAGVDTIHALSFAA